MVVADPAGFLLTVCENGYGKRTPFGANMAGEPAEAGRRAEETAARTEEEQGEPRRSGRRPEARRGTAARRMRYRKQRRGGKGVRDIRTSERNGPVVGVVSVRDDDDIMLITPQGMVNRTHVSEIRVDRPQYAGRAHHEPERRRQDRVDRQGCTGGRLKRNERWRQRKG